MLLLVRYLPSTVAACWRRPPPPPSDRRSAAQTAGRRNRLTTHAKCTASEPEFPEIHQPHPGNRCRSASAIPPPARPQHPEPPIEMARGRLGFFDIRTRRSSLCDAKHRCEALTQKTSLHRQGVYSQILERMALRRTACVIRCRPCPECVFPPMSLVILRRAARRQWWRRSARRSAFSSRPSFPKRYGCTAACRNGSARHRSRPCGM